MPSLDRPRTTETLLPPGLEQQATGTLTQLAVYLRTRHIGGVVMSERELTIPCQVPAGHREVIITCRPRPTDVGDTAMKVFQPGKARK